MHGASSAEEARARRAPDSRQGGGQRRGGRAARAPGAPAGRRRLQQALAAQSALGATAALTQLAAVEGPVLGVLAAAGASMVVGEAPAVISGGTVRARPVHHFSIPYRKPTLLLIINIISSSCTTCFVPAGHPWGGRSLCCIGGCFWS